MKEILRQAAKATKASQSQPKQAKASKSKQKKAKTSNRASQSLRSKRIPLQQGAPAKILRKSAPNTPTAQNSPQRPRMTQDARKFLPNPPETIAKSSENLLKSSQHPSQTAPRAPLKTTPNTRMKKRVSKTTQKAPRAYKPFPKLPPNPAKWNPRRPQIRILTVFWVCFFQSQICIDFLLLFCKICVVFQKPTFKFHAPTQCFVALHTV